MKVSILRLYSKTYQVFITEGVQSFAFAYTGTKKECEWYASMVQKAIENHNKSLPIINQYMEK